MSTKRSVDLWFNHVNLFHACEFVISISHQIVTLFCSLEENFWSSNLHAWFANLIFYEPREQCWVTNLVEKSFLTTLLKIEPDLHGWISSLTVRVLEFNTVLRSNNFFWKKKIYCHGMHPKQHLRGGNVAGIIISNLSTWSCTHLFFAKQNYQRLILMKLFHFRNLLCVYIAVSGLFWLLELFDFFDFFFEFSRIFTNFYLIIRALEFCLQAIFQMHVL